MEELKKENASLEKELNTLQSDSVSKKKSENIAYQIMWLTLFLVTVIHTFTMWLTITQMANCQILLIKTTTSAGV